MLKISAFYLEKQKSVIPKKIGSKPYGQNSSFLDRWPLLDGAIFSEGFGLIIVKNKTEKLFSHIQPEQLNISLQYAKQAKPSQAENLKKQKQVKSGKQWKCEKAEVVGQNGRADFQKNLLKNPESEMNYRYFSLFTNYVLKAHEDEFAIN